MRNFNPTNTQRVRGTSANVVVGAAATASAVVFVDIIVVGGGGASATVDNIFRTQPYTHNTP